VAGNPMIWRFLYHCRFLDFAACHHLGTAWMESASWRGINKTGNFSCKC